MIKSKELSDARSCMSRARDDEMTFVLLERDAAAPHAIREWVKERIRLGKNHPLDEQIAEALDCANYIETRVLTKKVNGMADDLMALCRKLRERFFK